ncbi:hypothetical protein C8Q74DRAFT_1298759 [Fomes fomentarius]|nr:hypothetical protein C8Q74DRAFT_1298759 [Fomes fomentarius]
MWSPLVLAGTFVTFVAAAGSAIEETLETAQIRFEVPLQAHLDNECPPITKHYQSGTLQVPLDWHNKTLGSIALNFFRRQARNATARRGTIFVNGGLSCWSSSADFSPP